jgi:hypothetical protein
MANILKYLVKKFLRRVMAERMGMTQVLEGIAVEIKTVMNSYVTEI